MKKTDLVDQVAKVARMERIAAKAAVEGVLSCIIDAVKTGEEVVLPGFGRFKGKDSPARQERDPVTGEIIEVAASRKLVFVAAKQAKEAIAGSELGRVPGPGVGAVGKSPAEPTGGNLA